MDATRWGETKGRYEGTKIQFESDLRQGGVLGEEGRVLEDPYLVVEVLKYLDWDHLLPLSLVCKTWYHITHNSSTLLHHLEVTRKLEEVGTVPQKVNSYACAMVVWYGYLAVGSLPSRIHLFYQNLSSFAISEVCCFSTSKKNTGFIDELETWLPEGEADVLLASTTSAGIFSLLKMKENCLLTVDALPVVQVEEIVHQDHQGAIHICKHDNRLFVADARIVKEVNSKGETIWSFETAFSTGRMVSWQGYLCLASRGVAAYTLTGEKVKYVSLPEIRKLYVFNDSYLICYGTYVIYVVDRNWNIVAESERQSGYVFAATNKGNRLITTDRGANVKLWAIQERKKETEKENKEGQYPLSLTCLQTLTKHDPYTVFCACWWNGRLYTGDYGGGHHSYLEILIH